MCVGTPNCTTLFSKGYTYLCEKRVRVECEVGWKHKSIAGRHYCVEIICEGNRSKGESWGVPISGGEQNYECESNGEVVLFSVHCDGIGWFYDGRDTCPKGTP